MLRYATAITLVLAFTGSALAEGAPAPLPRHAMKVCRSDRAHFCPDAPRGKATHECMKANMAKFSSACQSVMKAKQAAKKAAKRAAHAAPPPKVD